MALGSPTKARLTIRKMDTQEFVAFVQRLNDSNLPRRDVDMFFALLLGIRNGFGDQ
jgi:hypothetical protein